MSVIAERRLKQFQQKFGKAMVKFATHAALPVVLNSELVHLLRINFFYSDTSISYLTEAEFLLSSFCREIGEDLYEIEPAMRTVLLQKLYQQHPKHIKEIAALLWQYTKRYTPWRTRYRLQNAQLLTALGLQNAQLLTALNFLDAQKANAWFQEVEASGKALSQEEREWFVAMKKRAFIDRSIQRPPVKNYPDLRPYLIGRQKQVMSLLKAVNVHDKQYPFLCLIHGDQHQCHDRFFDRFVKYDLPKLKLVSDNEISYNFLPCRFYNGVETLHQEILERLSERLYCFSDGYSEIIDVIAKEKGPFLLYASMCTSDWLHSGGIKLVQEFIKFWANWSLPSRDSLLLVCLSFSYTGEPTNFLSRWRKKIVENQIRQEFKRLKFEEFKVNGIVLPELENIRKYEVEDWVKEYLWDCMDIFKPEIKELFKSSEKRSMEDLVEKLGPILKEYCT